MNPLYERIRVLLLELFDHQRQIGREEEDPDLIVIRIHNDSVGVFVLSGQVGMNGSRLNRAAIEHVDEDMKIGLRIVRNVVGSHRDLAIGERGFLQKHLR